MNKSKDIQREKRKAQQKERSRFLFLSRMDEMISQNEKVGSFLKEAKGAVMNSNATQLDLDRTMSRILVNYPEVQLRIFLLHTLTMIDDIRK